jgi:hypothetical protein
MVFKEVFGLFIHDLLLIRTANIVFVREFSNNVKDNFSTITYKISEFWTLINI